MPQWYLSKARLLMGLVLLFSISTLHASPSLKSFMQGVWQKTPAIQAARAALAAAQARELAANQPIYNPEINVDLERTDINTMSIGVSQTIDWGNKRSASTSKANAEIKLAEANLSKQRLSVAEEVLAALINLQFIENLLTLARQRVDLMQDFVDNTEKRHQAGDIGLQDVALARVALSQAKMQFANSEANKSKFIAQLQAAAETNLSEWPILTEELQGLAPLKNLDEYLRQLPLLNALRAELAASKSNISLSKAKRKADPSFGLRGGADNGNALIGLSFSMPLNLRNVYRAEVAVANQESLQVEQLLLSAIRRAQAHLRGSHQRYRRTHDAWLLWKKTGLSSLNEQLTLIQTIWISGEMSTSNYLVQAKQNVDAQETAVELSAQMWESWLEWLAASGQIEQWINQPK